MSAQKHKLWVFENFRFLVVKFSVYLNRRVFVMSYFLCASAGLYMAFVLSLFDPCLSFLWCLGRAVLRNACQTIRLKHYICIYLNVLYSFQSLKETF